MGMATMLSPGVTIREFDFSETVPQTAISNGAVVGGFQWGPVDEITLISSESRFVKMFGKPDTDTYAWWYTAKNFLDYSRNLRIVRVVDDATFKNAASDASGILVKSEDDYQTKWDDGTTLSGIEFIAKYPGVLGNSIKVLLADYETYTGLDINTLVVSAAGTAYDGTDTVTISAPDDAGGVQATATIVLDGSTVDSLVLVEAGSGYLKPPTITFNNEVGSGAAATINVWEYGSSFLSAPIDSKSVEDAGGSNDGLHVLVLDEDGVITGIAGTVLERFAFMSKALDGINEDGTSNYYVNVIRDQSKYVYVGDHVSEGTNWGTAKTATFTSMYVAGVAANIFTASLSAGVGDNSTIDNNELMPGWDLFKNKATVDVGLLMTADADATLKNYIIQNIAEWRKDCIACLSPDMEDVVNNVGSEALDTIAGRTVLTSSSFAVMDGNWKYQFDVYNNLFRWVPCNGDIAGLAARTDSDRDPWWSPAGFNRGHIKNVVKLAWNPDNTDRDELYAVGVNPIVSFPGEGPVLFGDKTMQTKPSAFDRINVRRLFIVLEKAIGKAAQYQLFEFNDAFTRQRFIQMVEPFLRDVKGRRGIYDYQVVCDETNNTGTVIDANSFVGDIFIKPAKSINFITLNFVATQTGVEFSEIITAFNPQ